MSRQLAAIGQVGLVAMLLTGWISTAEAVDKGKTSYTADAVCAFRSIGALDPDPKTRNPDYMAKQFVNPALNHHFPGLGLSFEDAKIAMDQMQTGVYYWIKSWTRRDLQSIRRPSTSGKV